MTARWTRRALALLWCIVALAAAQPANAADAPLQKAKEYFRAGAQAYAIGEFAAAVQAFEQAYALVPRPAVLFSIAQAERRQYFLDHQRQHLVRAVEMYRKYLEEDPQASRKVDAVQALSELEPLLAPPVKAAQPKPARKPVAAPPTRLMLSSAAPNAIISLDGQPPSRSPLIHEVEPGEHVVRVSAPGFVDSRRRVLAVKGALVALDVALKELPSRLIVVARAGAELRIDGRFQGECPFPRPIEVAPGDHLITLTKSGFVGVSKEVRFGRGETKTLRASMPRSFKRTAAMIMLGAGASALTAGGVLTYFAVEQESSAKSFLKERGNSTLTSDDLAQYDSTRRDRDALKLAASVSLASGAVLIAGSALIYLLDGGSVIGSANTKTKAAAGRASHWSAGPAVGPGLAGLTVQSRF